MSKHKQRWLKKEDMKLYLAIILICFLVAAVLHFLLDKGSHLIEEAHQVTAIDLSPSSMENLKKAYGDKIDADKISSAKKVLEEKMDAAEIEKLKKAYKEKIDPADLKKLEQAYKGE